MCFGPQRSIYTHWINTNPLGSTDVAAERDPQKEFRLKNTVLPEAVRSRGGSSRLRNAARLYNAPNVYLTTVADTVLGLCKHQGIL